MKQNKYIIALSLLLIIFYNICSAQEIKNTMHRWINPLRIGLEYTNNSYIGPVFQYNIWKTLHINCKLKYNPQTEDSYLLPGLKYNFSYENLSFSPFVEFQYGKLDYNKKFYFEYDGMKVIRYCAGYDYDPITGESNCISWVEGSKDDEVVISGVSLFGGLEYPINKFIINIGYGISYFPDVDNSDMEKLLSLYVLGFYYSFASEN